MNIDRIITESINIVLKENAQNYFQQLSNSYYNLQRYRIDIQNTNLNNSGSQQVISFIGHEFYNFICALEKALKRCISKQSINEINLTSALSDWGFYVPQEISYGDNLRNSYNYKIKNYFRRQAGQNTGSKSNGYSKSFGNDKKLLDLLNNIWPDISQKFYRVNSRNNLQNICSAAVNAKKEVEAIIQIVKLIQASMQQQNTNNNAQGTNP